MGYFALLMIFLAPIIQVILSTLKLKAKINLHLGIIALLAFVLGIILSISAFSLLCSQIQWKKNEIHCVTGEAGVMMCGFFITVACTPLIAIVFAAISYYRNKKRQTTSYPYQNY
ncbi:MAG: hypothetical protein ABIN91_10575 [Mucilaginibacter sp.]|uniref:hypothetical protein n=1 Tax=Mucilaginibacter sp. TaxID=1882438 RepID=UPI003264B4AD